MCDKLRNGNKGQLGAGSASFFTTTINDTHIAAGIHCGTMPVLQAYSYAYKRINYQPFKK